jgi:hypothetical protein
VVLVGTKVAENIYLISGAALHLGNLLFFVFLTKGKEKRLLRIGRKERFSNAGCDDEIFCKLLPPVHMAREALNLIFLQ